MPSFNTSGPTEQFLHEAVPGIESPKNLVAADFGGRLRVADPLPSNEPRWPQANDAVTLRFMWALAGPENVRPATDDAGDPPLFDMFKRGAEEFAARAEADSDLRASRGAIRAVMKEFVERFHKGVTDADLSNRNQEMLRSTKFEASLARFSILGTWLATVPGVRPSNGLHLPFYIGPGLNLDGVLAEVGQTASKAQQSLLTQLEYTEEAMALPTTRSFAAFRAATTAEGTRVVRPQGPIPRINDMLIVADGTLLSIYPGVRARPGSVSHLRHLARTALRETDVEAVAVYCARTGQLIERGVDDFFSALGATVRTSELREQYSSFCKKPKGEAAALRGRRPASANVTAGVAPSQADVALSSPPALPDQATQEKESPALRRLARRIAGAFWWLRN